MSYMLIKRITITPDLRVMVRAAANNIRPLFFRFDEVESLTEILRSKGRQTLELEILSLFLRGLWKGNSRYYRAVVYTLLTDCLDKYEVWERCRRDNEYERHLLLRMWGFLHYRPVPCRCHLEHQGRPVRRLSSGRISFSHQFRRIFPSVIDAQAAVVAKGWNLKEFRIVEEDNNHFQKSKSK